MRNNRKKQCVSWFNKTFENIASGQSIYMLTGKVKVLTFGVEWFNEQFCCDIPRIEN